VRLFVIVALAAFLAGCTDVHVTPTAPTPTPTGAAAVVRDLVEYRVSGTPATVLIGRRWPGANDHHTPVLDHVQNGSGAGVPVPRGDADRLRVHGVPVSECADLRQWRAVPGVLDEHVRNRDGDGHLAPLTGSSAPARAQARRAGDRGPGGRLAAGRGILDTEGLCSQRQP
jgi:hypothetical protein